MSARALTDSELYDLERTGFPSAVSIANKSNSVAPIARRLGIFAGGRPTVISGGPEAMKSFVSSEIALRVGLGDSHGFGGEVRIEMHGHVVYLDYENPSANRTVERFPRLGGHDAVEALKLSEYGVARIDVKAPNIFLDDPRAEQLLIEILDGVALCVVDSIQFGCRHQAEHYSAAIARLGRVSAVTGCAIVVILHPIKGWERRQGLDRLDFVTGREFDTALWLEKDSKQVTTITSIKNANAAGPIETLRVRLVDEGEVDEVTGLSERIRFEAVGVPTKAPPKLTATEKVRRRILRALEDEQLSYRGLREEVTGNNAAIKAVLDELVQVGDVVQDPETSLYALAGGGPSRSLGGDEISKNTEKRAVPPVRAVDTRIGDASTSRSIEKTAVPSGPSRSLDPPVPASPPPVRGGTRTETDGGRGEA